MVSKNKLCSYSPIASIWTAKRIMGYGSGGYMNLRTNRTTLNTPNTPNTLNE